VSAFLGNSGLVQSFIPVFIFHILDHRRTRRGPWPTPTPPSAESATGSDTPPGPPCLYVSWAYIRHSSIVYSMHAAIEARAGELSGPELSQLDTLLVYLFSTRAVTVTITVTIHSQAPEPLRHRGSVPTLFLRPACMPRQVK